MKYIWSIITIFVGIYAIYLSQSSTLDEPIPTIMLILGILCMIFGPFNLILDARKFKKEKEKSKPMCEYCGYIALDERELHNHQITCVKKPN